MCLGFSGSEECILEIDGNLLRESAELYLGALPHGKLMDYVMQYPIWDAYLRVVLGAVCLRDSL